ncbi:hypothetical protein Peur_056302 [Populus x canadensis]
MGVITYEREVNTTIPPAKMFKALAIDGNDIVAKVFPQAIKNIVNLDGDGGPGTIKQINFDEDKENFTYAYSMVEGDALTNKFHMRLNLRPPLKEDGIHLQEQHQVLHD